MMGFIFYNNFGMTHIKLVYTDNNLVFGNQFKFGHDTIARKQTLIVVFDLQFAHQP